MNKDSSQCGYSPKAYIATLNWKAVCGESRTHGLEGAEGRPSTATLRFTGFKDLQDWVLSLTENCTHRITELFIETSFKQY